FPLRRRSPTPIVALMKPTLEQRSSWSIAAGVLRTVPRRSKIFLGVFVPFLFAFTAWLIYDHYASGKAGGQGRVLALAVGNAGLFLIAITQMLHAASQRSSAICERTGLTHRVQRMHHMLMALPAMAFTAGVLITVSVVTLLPEAIRSPLLFLSVAMYGAFIPMAFSMVTGTTRFLYQHASEQAEAAARARSEAAEAQLAALQAQMNPHFLFNALNTVASLVRTDARAAESTVENLASVLRRTLDRSRRTLSTVEDEVDYVQAYLAVEQERHGARLEVVWAVDPQTLPLAVPTMTLQPLVENALKHAMGARLEGGRILISSTLRDGVLTLTVADDGAGFAGRYRDGTGLANLRARLLTIFDERARLTIDSSTSGATVRVEIAQSPGSSPDDSSARTAERGPPAVGAPLVG
ncbi:MAG TPA: histidine kinase, partial [Gemmatimonadaceae bacterium]|nr:histidine kinase [Gemmatimonadaceae bacterium]